MAHPKHQDVRLRFGGRCGYCGVSDVEAAGDLTVDHFVPTSAGGDESDDNLIYSCFRCNNYKGAYVVEASDFAHGRRLLHPLHDDIGQHIQEDHRTGLLVALTETGQFHVDVLHLNRPALVQHRLEVRLAERRREKLLYLEAENAWLWEREAQRELRTTLLRRILGPESPEIR